MPNYRLYFLDSQGHIVRAVELSARTDQQAISQAQHTAKGAPVELWDGGRCILSWLPASSQPPPASETLSRSSDASP